MSTTNKQHDNILLAVIGFTSVIAIVATIGYFTLSRSSEVIQGEVEVTEYRVSSKVPGRILELRVKEGDYVHVGDTLAILESPEVSAQDCFTASVYRRNSSLFPRSDLSKWLEWFALARAVTRLSFVSPASPVSFSGSCLSA